MQGGHDDDKSFDEKAEAAAAVVALSNLSPGSLRCQAGGATVPADVDARMSTVLNERNYQDIPSKKQQPVQWQGCGNESTREQGRQRRPREIENEIKPLPTLRHHFSRSKIRYNDQGSANSSSESSTHTANSSFEMNRLSSGYEGSKSAGSSDSLSAGDSGNGNGGSKHGVENKVGSQELCNDYHESDDLDEEYYTNSGKSVKFSIKPVHTSARADYSMKKRQRMGQYDEAETSGKGSSTRGEYRSLSSSSSSCSCSDDADDANVRKDSIDTVIGGDCGPAVSFVRKEKLDQSFNDGVSSRLSFPTPPKLTPTNSGNASSASYTGTTMSETADSATAQSQSISAAKSSESSPTHAIKPAGLKAPEDEDEEMESAHDLTNEFKGCKTGSPSLTSSGQATEEPATETPTKAMEHSPSIDSGSKITKSPSFSSQFGTKSRELRPAPYYYYIDHSRDRDEDPTSPLSQPLYAPNFAAKMHAILIREELSDIITWMPHGRSWKIVNPDEFEAKLLPVYFNHTKIASFYRQANGWGFRRMLKGSDKGSFYNENFLRGLPHLAKKMARTGGVKIVDDKKLDSNIAHEPNLWMISDEHPVPETVDKDTLSYAALKAINECILEGGPKARMPVLPQKRYNSDYSSSRVTTRQLEQVGANNSNKKQSSESSIKESPNEPGSSSHLYTINSAAHAISATQLPSPSHRMKTCASFVQQQGHDDTTHALNPQILMSQQSQQQPQKYNQKKNVQQNQQQVAWNNMTQDSIMSFISSQLSANAAQQQQQQQQQLQQKPPNLANIFLNPSLLNAGPSVIQGLDIFLHGQQ
ncbi:hypothetical protein ACHAXS_007112, partial [Conticribra weissflogii]